MGAESHEKTNLHDNDGKNSGMKLSRRSLINAAINVGTVTMILTKTQPSNAGLVQFPCTYDLMNQYHIMRAGESQLESQDIISTNPLFL